MNIKNLTNGVLLALGIKPNYLKNNEFRGVINGKLYTRKKAYRRAVHRLGRKNAIFEANVLLDITDC